MTASTLTEQQQFGPPRMSRGGYDRLTEEPSLRPPSREYVESYCKTRTTATPQATYAVRPLPTAAVDSRRGPRLFDAAPGDAVDYASYCAALGQHRECRGLRDADEIQRRTDRVHVLATAVTLLALTQTVCACVFAYTLFLDLFSGSQDSLSLITCLVVMASGCVGLVGGLRRAQWALQAFFILQIWALALVFAQWLRMQQQSGRTSLFCRQHMSDSGASTALQCANAIPITQVAAVVLALAVVYCSMFVTDTLAERLQDELEQEDQLSLIRFSWLMHRKTLIGVQRFEDLIHAKFEELVTMGFLRPRQAATLTSPSEPPPFFGHRGRG